MLCTSDFHIGTQINLLLPHRLLTLPPSQDSSKQQRNNTLAKRMNKNSVAFPYGARLETVNSDRSCLISGSRDGSIGILLPIDERVYHRLALLQQILSSTYFSPFGLNPKYYFFLYTFF